MFITHTKKTPCVKRQKGKLKKKPCMQSSRFTNLYQDTFSCLRQLLRASVLNLLVLMNAFTLPNSLYIDSEVVKLINTVSIAK